MFDFLKRIFNPEPEQPPASEPPPTPKKLTRSQVMKILAMQDKGTLLRHVDLSGEDLSGLIFASVDMDKTKFARANLTGSDMRKAYLANVDLSDADLTEADLREANLSLANLSGANLTDADLANANLSSTNLTKVNFTGATLLGCHLGSAKLTGVILPDGTTYSLDTDLSTFGVKGVPTNKLRGL